MRFGPQNGDLFQNAENLVSVWPLLRVSRRCPSINPGRGSHPGWGDERLWWREAVLGLPHPWQGRAKNCQQFGGIGRAIGFKLGLGDAVSALGAEQHDLIG